ncbi:DUF6261 family protein [Capnocytophaga cynodegmi]|uniref:DUF6261 family protein n=1 Tax=Capnocytophaga cynodegmi TaxID=28189 RepID=UPI0037D387BD
MKRLLTIVRVSELADIAHRLVGLFHQENELQTDAFLKNLFEKIDTQATALSVAIKKEVAVSKLEEADNLRDETIMNLSNILLGYRSMRSLEIRESAEKLYAVFDRYGTKITRENYSSESAHIESLLRDFSATELQEAIGKLLGVSDTIEELRTRQTAFHTERMAYEKSVSEQGFDESATALKKPLLGLINTKLISYLAALQEESTYANFAKVVSQVIDDANATINRRGKK